MSINVQILGTDGGQVFPYLLENKQIFYRHLRQVLRERYLPETRDLTPVDTGALRAAWRARSGRTYAAVQVSPYARNRRRQGNRRRKLLTPRIYARWVDFQPGPGEKRVGKMLQDLHAKYGNAAIQEALDRTIAEVKQLTQSAT